MTDKVPLQYGFLLPKRESICSKTSFSCSFRWFGVMGGDVAGGGDIGGSLGVGLLGELRVSDIGESMAKKVYEARVPY